MINWLKNKQKQSSESEVNLLVDTDVALDIVENPKLDFFSRFKQGLSKTRQQFGSGIAHLFLGKKEIDAAVLTELEELLLRADLGFAMTQSIIHGLTADMQRKHLADPQVVITNLKKKLDEALISCMRPLVINTQTKTPFVILMVGVNGAGKTTTIGKLAKLFQQQGKQVMLAAGDTFRAAAVEQLQTWGKRNNVPVIAQHTGADSASVIFDAFQAAKSRGMDVLIADTAGRLHTQDNLMAELKKVKRVLQKIDDAAPHEIMLVLDAGIGQNAINQTRQFHEAIGLSGITMTKLDGTAKGGILFALAHEFGLPFRYIGIGEGIDDLQSFDATQFVEAIFDDNIQTSQ
jgi:fused signal recognition particle receptor